MFALGLGVRVGVKVRVRDAWGTEGLAYEMSGSREEQDSVSTWDICRKLAPIILRSVCNGFNTATYDVLSCKITDWL